MKYAVLTVCLVSLFIQTGFARDNGDGTYSNPMIFADYPDCEVIRVGTDYYYLSSTFHWIPGNPILHSKDLVNWKPVGHTIPDYKWDRRYDLGEHGNGYGYGSWAPTLRYHDGTFYSACYVWTDRGANKGRFYLSRSKSIEGPWETNLIDEHLYDPALFFDDDGRVYVFHGQNDIFVTELDKDLREVITPAKLIFRGRNYFEGAHAYKINGLYYLFCTGTGQQQCLRSKNIEGPYEHKTVCVADLNFPNSYLHQGGLVDTPSGEWWAIIFQDHGKHGRIPFLLPVTWEDGWPMVQPVMTHKKPDVGNVPSNTEGQSWRCDDFSTPSLGLQWQWNHHPDQSGWSLTERPGWLRLRTTHQADVLRKARNTLAQQMMGPDSGAVAKFDVSKMKDGDIAGLGLFSAYSSSIAVVAKDGQKHLAVITEMPREGRKEGAAVPLTSDTVWLRAEVPYLEYAVSYAYSTDGKTFTPLGDKLGVSFEFFWDWLAPRYCLYNYTTQETGGYVDIDWFEYILPKQKTNLYGFGDPIDAMFYDEISNPLERTFKWVDDGMENIFLHVDRISIIAKGWHDKSYAWTGAYEAKQRGNWIKFNRIDFGKQAKAICVRAMGEGTVSIRLKDKNGPVIAEGTVSSADFKTVELRLEKLMQGVHPVTVVFMPDDQQSIVLRHLRIK